MSTHTHIKNRCIRIWAGQGPSAKSHAPAFGAWQQHGSVQSCPFVIMEPTDQSIRLDRGPPAPRGRPASVHRAAASFSHTGPGLAQQSELGAGLAACPGTFSQSRGRVDRHRRQHCPVQHAIARDAALSQLHVRLHPHLAAIVLRAAMMGLAIEQQERSLDQYRARRRRQTAISPRVI